MGGHFRRKEVGRINVGKSGRKELDAIGENKAVEKRENEMEKKCLEGGPPNPFVHIYVCNPLSRVYPLNQHESLANDQAREDG